jgi:hypothetical protein
MREAHGSYYQRNPAMILDRPTASGITAKIFPNNGSMLLSQEEHGISSYSLEVFGRYLPSK